MDANLNYIAYVTTVASLRQLCSRDFAHTAVDTSLLAIAGLEEQVSDLQEALADAKSVSEQAMSSQQAAEKGAAQAQELRREVADLRKALDDRHTEMKSFKACASMCWKLCSSNLSRCPCMLCAFRTQATPQDVANKSASGFSGVYQ